MSNLEQAKQALDTELDQWETDATAIWQDVIDKGLDKPLKIKLKGGAGSGNFGHSGRKGMVGGSGTDTLMFAVPDNLPKYAQGFGKPIINERYDSPTQMNASFEIQHEVPINVGGELHPYTSSHLRGKILANTKEIVLSSIHVDDNLRRRGIATALINRALQNLPKDYTVTTTGVHSPDGAALYDYLKKIGVTKEFIPQIRVKHIAESPLKENFEAKIGCYSVKGKKLRIRVQNIATDVVVVEKGGPGSGDFGHRGRPGKVGGSAEAGGYVFRINGDEGTTRHTISRRQIQERRLSRKVPKTTVSKNVQMVKDYVDARLTNKAEPSYRTLLERRYGTKYSAELDAQATKDVKDITEKCSLCMAIRSSTLESMIKNGDTKFKNQHESLASGGMLDRRLRKRVENDYFGTTAIDDPNGDHEGASKVNNPDNYPIYGYMTDKKEMDNIDNYGDVIVELNDDVRARTTITGFDTLNHEGHAVTPVASNLDNPNWRSFIDYSYSGTNFNNSLPSTKDSRAKRQEYIEAQIHGGLTFKNIKLVSIMQSPSPDRYFQQQSLAAKLKELNIPYVFIPE